MVSPVCTMYEYQCACALLCLCQIQFQSEEGTELNAVDDDENSYIEWKQSWGWHISYSIIELSLPE